MKKPTKTAAKKKAYNAFQVYLRTLWTKDGQIPCYTCHRLLNFKQVQVGHWVTGHSNSTYINEDYVRPQCMRCNIMMGGRQGEFRDKVRDELTNKVVDQLILFAKEPMKITVEDYQELEAFYKNQLQEVVDK